VVAASCATCMGAVVSLQDISNFPELYSGVSVEVDNVILDGTLSKDQGFYCLSLVERDMLKSKEAARHGEYTPPFLNKKAPDVFGNCVQAKMI